MINLYPPNQMYFNNQMPTYRTNPVSNQSVYPQPDSYYNIGGIGYNTNYNNGGYYNGLYNNFYNPYEARRREELYQKQMQDQLENQKLFERALLKNKYAFNGKMLTDSEADEILANKNPNIVNNTLEPELLNVVNKSAIYENNSQQNKIVYDPELAKYYSGLNSCIEKNSKADNLMDFFKQVGDDLDKQNKIEQRLLNSNMQTMYNSEDYNSLLNFHNSTNNIMDEIDISDISVPMPTHLKNQFAKRREMFLNSIINRKEG